MYEGFRTEMQNELGWLDQATLEKVMHCMDKVATGYDVTQKETHLEPYIMEIPKEAKGFLIAKKVEGCAKATLDTYGMVITNFFSTIRKQPKDITAIDLRMWIYQYQESHGVASSTMEYYRGIINNFFVWTTQEGYLEKNPVITVKPIRCEKKQRSALTRVELEYLRAACCTARERAIVDTFFSTGCRVSELINLKSADIDWNAKTVHVLGKGDKHRTCFMNARCEVALKKYLSERDDESDYLFVSERKPHGKLGKSGMEKIMDKIYRRAQEKIKKKVTPHVLRHTTATLALQSGMRITNISTMLGHAKIDTTQVYAETSDQDVQMDHLRCVV